MKKITFLFMLLAVSVGYAQAPTDNPADPTNNPADVISMYGDTFTNVATNYDPNWGQSGHTQVNTSYDPGTGQLLLAYPNFNYQGTELTTQNASAMEFLHIDIWTAADPNATDIQVSPINNGTGTGETLVSIAYTSGSWTSVDIPKSAFTGMTWDSVFQMKFAANGPGSVVPVDIYLDNVYFWKAGADPLADATLSDLQIDGTTLSGFGSGTTDYTVQLPAGTTVVPQITSVTTTNMNASAVITQAPAIPGDATVVVTAENGSDMETYTVSMVAVGPSIAAPTPPARPAADVISLYSDAYTDVVSNFDAGWCGASSVAEITVAGNPTQAYKNNACQGIVLDAGIDASTFNNLHVDIYIEDGTDLTSSVFNLKFVQQPGGAALEINLNAASSPALVAGSWLSLDLPVDLTTFTGFKEFGITSNLNNLVWYDNLYVHKNTVLSTEEFSLENVSVSPNPTKNNWIIKTNNGQNITGVEVYDILGKEVYRTKTNTSEFSIDASSYNNGIYIAKISSANGTRTIKLVKN